MRLWPRGQDELCILNFVFVHDKHSFFTWNKKIDSRSFGVMNLMLHMIPLKYKFC